MKRKDFTSSFLYLLAACVFGAEGLYVPCAALLAVTYISAIFARPTLAVYDQEKA